jgi:hypothetical protein
MTYLIGIGSIVGLMIAWAAVQHYWKASFTEEMTQDDALAERSSCGNCSCAGKSCVNKNL